MKKYSALCRKICTTAPTTTKAGQRIATKLHYLQDLQKVRQTLTDLIPHEGDGSSSPRLTVCTTDLDDFSSLLISDDGKNGSSFSTTATKSKISGGGRWGTLIDTMVSIPTHPLNFSVAAGSPSYYKRILQNSLHGSFDGMEDLRSGNLRSWHTVWKPGVFQELSPQVESVEWTLDDDIKERCHFFE